MNRAATCRKPFIVHMPAQVLRKNVRATKAARTLYSTMKSLADAKTGELAVNGNPLHWRYIANQAEIGRDVWQRCLKELMAAGGVRREREIVESYRSGRKRIVWGRARYFVLPMPDFTAAEESGTQVLSDTLKVKSGHQKKPLTPCLSVVLRQDHDEHKEKPNESTLLRPDLTKATPKTTATPADREKHPQYRTDLSLQIVLGMEQKYLKAEDRDLWGELESHWRDAGCPVDRLLLEKFLDSRIVRMTREKLPYPPFLLRRLKQLRRREFSPRLDGPGSGISLGGCCIGGYTPDGKICHCPKGEPHRAQFSKWGMRFEALEGFALPVATPGMERH